MVSSSIMVLQKEILLYVRLSMSARVYYNLENECRL